MKAKFLSIVLLLSFSTVSSGQNLLSEGDACFDAGNYQCAVEKYQKQLEIDYHQDVEIKLIRARSCKESLQKANLMFSQKKYADAKRAFQEILESNPKDEYARAKIAECEKMLNPPAVNPPVVNPPVTTVVTKKEETTLSVSQEELYFPASGGTSGHIEVYSNANLYSVSLVPMWYTVQTYNGYFVVSCKTNNTSQSRSEWFQVTADDKIMKIYVNQEGRTYTPVQRSSASQKPIQRRASQCFNCPQGNISAWGLTLGYAQTADINGEAQDGLQAGIKCEPLFNYGFGLNLGLNYEYYNRYNKYYYYSVLNFNTDLEYRFNFSQWFNPYIYSGVSFDYNFYARESYYIKNSTDNTERFFKYVDFGAGLRISHLQFNVSKSILWEYSESSSDIIEFFNKPGKLIFSISYMF